MDIEHPRDWHNVLPMVMWCLRKVENEMTAWTLAMGHLPRGLLAILKESRCNDEHLPVSFGKNASDYLTELHRKLEIAKTYAASHTEREQQRYVSHYNLRSRNKHFDLEEQVLILTPDSTSHSFNKWTGPAKIVDVRSPYSYTVELENGSRRIFHANKLRKFNVRVESVICDSLIEELEPLIHVLWCMRTMKILDS